MVAYSSDKDCDEDYTRKCSYDQIFKAVLFSSFVDLFFVQR